MHNKKIIIIFGQGRSGSTLIQRILHCAIENAHFTGENDNFWYHMFLAYQSLKETNHMYHSDIGNKGKIYSREDLFKPSWYNILSEHELIHKYREIFLQMHAKAESRVAGFKEIRFPNDYEKFKAYAEFFKTMFPQVLFVFTIRNIETVITSGWWTPADRDHLLGIKYIFEEYEKSDKNSYIINYEDMQNTEKILDLFSFLQEPLDFDSCERVISRRYRFP